jgi:3-hydroxyisobutyrate dehydrogenase
VPHARAATRRVADQREDAHVQALDNASQPDDAHVMVALLPISLPEYLETVVPVVHSDATDSRLAFGSVEEIFAAVENKGTDRASDTLKNLRHMLPTGLEVALMRMRRPMERRMGREPLGDAMTMEYGMSQALMSKSREWNHGMKGGVVVSSVRSATAMLARKPGLDHQKLFDISSISFGQFRPPGRYCPAGRRKIQGRQNPCEQPIGAKTGAYHTMFADDGSDKLGFSAIIKMLRGTC